MRRETGLPAQVIRRQRTIPIPSDMEMAMRRSIRNLLSVGLVAISLGQAGHADEKATQHYADKDVLAYRQHIMNVLNEQSSALGQILSTVVPDDQAVQHLQIIALTASTALRAFEPKVPGGEAKPEVWSNWTDFSKRMNEFAQKTAQAAKTAKEQGSEVVMENILDVLTCKSCHDVYRAEKK